MNKYSGLRVSKHDIFLRMYFLDFFCLSPDALQDVKTIAMTDDRNTRRLRHANIASVSLSNYPTLPPVELDAVPAVENNSPGYNCKVTSLCFSI